MIHSMLQRLDDLKFQLRSTSLSSGGSDLEVKEEHVLQDGLSAAAAALQATDSGDCKNTKQLLEQEHLQKSLPHLQLQLELYAADAAAPLLSLHDEAEIMAAAQQGR
jgi:hypothetical protein